MQIIRQFLTSHNISDTVFAIGVSGGADSLALALLFKEECPQYRLVALTVDHGLRPSSRKEAEYVAQIMKKHGIEHHILEWIGEKPQTGIEEKAREARYQLLCQWCEKNQITNLVIAHHIFDQAETFLMRLQRGSGLFGLSAMNEISKRENIRILRPFLHTPPEQLKNYLNNRSIDWVEDESNHCADFLRVRMRQFLPKLEQETGISPIRIDEATTDLRKIRRLVEKLIEKFIETKVHNWNNCGFSFDFSAFIDLPEELRFYVLAKLMTSLNKKAYIPEADSLEALINQIEKPNFAHTTLGNCHIIKEDFKIWIISEIREKAFDYTIKKWENYMVETPEVRGIKLPLQLRKALILKKI